MVEPPALRLSTAVFSVSTEVISWVFWVAVSAKLTMPIRLPEPIWPSCELSVASSMMSINFFAPFFMLVSGLPDILPERSSTSTMSVGVLLMSGEADSASVTFKEPEQSIRSMLMVLFELFSPIVISPLMFWALGGPGTVYAQQAQPASGFVRKILWRFVLCLRTRGKAQCFC